MDGRKTVNGDLSNKVEPEWGHIIEELDTLLSINWFPSCGCSKDYSDIKRPDRVIAGARLNSACLSNDTQWFCSEDYDKNK